MSEWSVQRDGPYPVVSTTGFGKDDEDTHPEFAAKVLWVSQLAVNAHCEIMFRAIAFAENGYQNVTIEVLHADALGAPSWRDIEDENDGDDITLDKGVFGRILSNMYHWGMNNR